MGDKGGLNIHNLSRIIFLMKSDGNCICTPASYSTDDRHVAIGRHQYVVPFWGANMSIAEAPSDGHNIHLKVDERRRMHDVYSDEN